MDENTEVLIEEETEEVTGTEPASEVKEETEGTDGASEE